MLGYTITCSTMASSLYLSSLMDSIHELCEDHVSSILHDIALEYNLNYAILIGKYVKKGQKDLSPVTRETYKIAQSPSPPLEIPKPRVVTDAIKGQKDPSPVISKPHVVVKEKKERKKGGRKPKFANKPTLDGTLSDSLLKDLTIPLLKDACRMRKIPISGSKDDLIDRIKRYQTNPDTFKIVKGGGRKKKDMAPEPVHNHELDSHIHSDCEQCRIYGNPMAPDTQEEEFIVETHNVSDTPVKNIEENESDEENSEEEINKQLKNILSSYKTDEEDEEDEENWEEYKEPDDGDGDYGINYGDELEEEE